MEKPSSPKPVMQENEGVRSGAYRRGYAKRTQRDFRCVYTFKEIRNYQTNQQAIFLALLNKHFDLHIQQQIKRRLVTRPFFRIEAIVSPDDAVRINEFVETRCKERYLYETHHGVSDKTAQRRCETYKITEGLHILMDILFEFGYFFESRITTGKRGTTKNETVYKVFCNGVLLLTQHDIEERGVAINQYIHGQITNNATNVFRRNDAGLARALGF